MKKEETKVLSAIQEVATTAIPQGAKVILFGSRARGDAKKGSDWDVLILTDSETEKTENQDQYTYPFWELGWKMNAMIHPIVYTTKRWQQSVNPIFRQNVEREGIVIC